MDIQNALLFVISVFCISTMFALGLEVTLTEISIPFRNWLAVAILVLANNVIMPLLAVVILAAPEVLPAPLNETVKGLLKLVDGQRIGFLLVALAAGGIVAPTLVDLAKGSVALAKGTTLVLVLASVILMPVEIGLLGQTNLFDSKTVNAWSIFNTLLLFQLLPLALGIGIKTWYDTLAGLLRPQISQLAKLSFLIVLLLLPATGQWPTLAPNFPAVEIPLVSKPSGIAKGMVETLNQVTNGRFTEDAAKSFNKPISDTLTITTTAQLQKQDNNKWRIVDAGKTYIVVSDTSTIRVSAVKPYWFSIRSTDNKLSDKLNALSAGGTLDTSDSITGTAAALLIKTFSHHSVTIRETSAITVVTEIGGWKITEAGNVYALKFMDQTLNVYNQTLQPTGIIADVLQFLYKQPTLAAMLEFLRQLINIVLPLAAYSAVALILLKIGYYAGLLLNNATGATTLNVARTESIVAAVRNVSAALIVAAVHFSPTTGQKNDLSAVGVILIFYTVSLIVAAIQADKWSRQPETAPVAPASQAQASAITPERGATSTP